MDFRYVRARTRSFNFSLHDLPMSFVILQIYPPPPRFLSANVQPPPLGSPVFVHPFFIEFAQPLFHTFLLVGLTPPNLLTLSLSLSLSLYLSLSLSNVPLSYRCLTLALPDFFVNSTLLSHLFIFRFSLHADNTSLFRISGYLAFLGVPRRSGGWRKMNHACAALFHRDLLTQRVILRVSPTLSPTTALPSVSSSFFFDFDVRIEAEPLFGCHRKTHTGIESRSPYQITVPIDLPPTPQTRTLLFSGISKQVVPR